MHVGPRRTMPAGKRGGIEFALRLQLPSHWGRWGGEGEGSVRAGSRLGIGVGVGVFDGRCGVLVRMGWA